MSHVMQRIAVYETGAEQWSCPECGKMFIAQIPPAPVNVIDLAIGEMCDHVGASDGYPRAKIGMDGPLPDDDWVWEND
jgi:hypothetical protein